MDPAARVNGDDYMFHVLIASLLLLVSIPSRAQDVLCEWQADQRVRIENGWVEVKQGRDESSQRLRVAVWGPERVKASCEQLDDDPAPEVVITSRGVGSGPYYRLQIIDFSEDGILSWSYRSDGAPKVESKDVVLGDLTGRYQEAGATPVYTTYRYTQNGLVQQSDKMTWILYMTFIVNGDESNVTLADGLSSDSCMRLGEILVQKLKSDLNGLQSSFECLDFEEIVEHLKPLINVLQ